MLEVCDILECGRYSVQAFERHLLRSISVSCCRRPFRAKRVPLESRSWTDSARYNEEDSQVQECRRFGLSDVLSYRFRALVR